MNLAAKKKPGIAAGLFALLTTSSDGANGDA